MRRRRIAAHERHARALARAKILAQHGDVDGARSIVAEMPAGPIVVIETVTIRPRNRVPHQTTAHITELFAAPFAACPNCGAYALCMLPPVLASMQTDETNAVCHPAHGGCNHGFQYTEDSPCRA